MSPDILKMSADSHLCSNFKNTHYRIFLTLTLSLNVELRDENVVYFFEIKKGSSLKRLLPFLSHFDRGKYDYFTESTIALNASG